MAKSFTQCEDIKKRIQAAIEDEAKAGPEYQQLAADTQEMFCGGQCPNGFLAKIGLQTLSVDEHKHHDFLVQLLASVEKDCEETREPELPPTIASIPLPAEFPLLPLERKYGMPPPPGFGKGAIPDMMVFKHPVATHGKAIELKLRRSSVPGEWVVRYYEDGKLNDDKSYYTDDKTDAAETMKLMMDRLRKGLP